MEMALTCAPCLTLLPLLHDFRKRPTACAGLTLRVRAAVAVAEEGAAA